MFRYGAGLCVTMTENAKNGSREIAMNGGLMNASYANRAKHAIEGLATETAVTENLATETAVIENVLSENAVIANVDLAAIAVKDEIAARAVAVVADR